MPHMTEPTITQAIRAKTGGDNPPKGAMAMFARDMDTTNATVTRWRDGTVPGSEWWPRLAEVLDLPEAEVEALAIRSRRQDWRTAVAELHQRLDALQRESDSAGQRLTKRVAMNERRLAALEELLARQEPGGNAGAGD
jgi:hypothetical protein